MIYWRVDEISVCDEVWAGGIFQRRVFQRMGVKKGGLKKGSCYEGGSSKGECSWKLDQRMTEGGAQAGCYENPVRWIARSVLSWEHGSGLSPLVNKQLFINYWNFIFNKKIKRTFYIKSDVLCFIFKKRTGYSYVRVRISGSYSYNFIAIHFKAFIAIHIIQYNFNI